MSTPDVETTDMNELIELILKWSEERGITINGNIETQALKLVSEMGELADNIIKDKDVTDDIGDCIVVLTNIAALAGTNIRKCTNHAYNDIKDRKGILNKKGNFIKESDPSYKEAMAPRVNKANLLYEHSGLGFSYILEYSMSDGVIGKIKFNSIGGRLDVNILKDMTYEEICNFITNNWKGEIWKLGE